MSLVQLLEHPSEVHSPAVGLGDLEDAFREWARGPAKPDVVGVGTHPELTMVEVARRLQESRATLPAAACAQFGMPPGTMIATAAMELLHATIDPDGPRCRSFRSASYYLRGRADLETNSDGR